MNKRPPWTSSTRKRTQRVVVANASVAASNMQEAVFGSAEHVRRTTPPGGPNLQTQVRSLSMITRLRDFLPFFSSSSSVFRFSLRARGVITISVGLQWPLQCMIQQRVMRCHVWAAYFYPTWKAKVILNCPLKKIWGRQCRSSRVHGQGKSIPNKTPFNRNRRRVCLLKWNFVPTSFFLILIKVFCNERVTHLPFHLSHPTALIQKGKKAKVVFLRVHSTLKLDSFIPTPLETCLRRGCIHQAAHTSPSFQIDRINLTACRLLKHDPAIPSRDPIITLLCNLLTRSCFGFRSWWGNFCAVRRGGSLDYMPPSQRLNIRSGCAAIHVPVDPLPHLCFHEDTNKDIPQ